MDNTKRFPTEMRIKNVKWTELIQDQINYRFLYLWHWICGFNNSKILLAQASDLWLFEYNLHTRVRCV